ncbi:MAG: glycosyltransferase [Candidatus Sumerlaeaceae bacterium]|nr:glycosyltransferase [Candidatus Sumerlaeaceae bacterium]
MNASIAILTCNRLALLKDCITALKPQLKLGDEIVIADTGSSDGTRQWLKSQPPPIKAIEIDSDTDFATARNIAIRACDGEIVAFIDDDCLPPADWLANIRSGMKEADALGGPVLPGEQYEYPWWWTPELSWTVGLSTPGVLAGLPDYYPATANLAVRREIFDTIPFSETKVGFSSKQIYLGGREDADWWLRARIAGIRTRLLTSNPVMHRIPADRFQLEYIRNRARADGAAAWTRGHRAISPKEAARESWAVLFRQILSPLKLARFPAGIVEAHVWSQRQRAYAEAAGQPTGVVAAMAGLTQVTREKAGRILHRVRHALRSPLAIPSSPEHLLIAAPTFVGDTVLLRPPLHQLAHTFPQAKIQVWTQFPELLQGLPPNISTLVGGREVEVSANDAEVVFVPYYHSGTPDLWRGMLCRKAITFDGDVGFLRPRDYSLAARVIPKHYDRHEILNLAELIVPWPSNKQIEATSLNPDPGIQANLKTRFPSLFGQRFATIHMESELPMKTWPLDRWIRIAQTCEQDLGLAVALVGTSRETTKELEGLLTKASLKLCFNLCGQTDINQLVSLLGSAALAIGPCSGPKHIAMSIGTPTFTIYGPSNPLRWGAFFDQELHGHIISPTNGLTAAEHASLPANYTMLCVTAEAACNALMKHWMAVEGLRTGPA